MKNIFKMKMVFLPILTTLLLPTQAAIAPWSNNQECTVPDTQREMTSKIIKPNLDFMKDPMSILGGSTTGGMGFGSIATNNDVTLKVEFCQLKCLE